MIRVWKNSKESFERFLSRFDQQVQRARLVRVLRKRRYLQKDPSRSKRRAAALKREEYRAERERRKFY
jgi:ribosomal protein S21